MSNSAVNDIKRSEDKVIDQEDHSDTASAPPCKKQRVVSASNGTARNGNAKPTASGNEAAENSRKMAKNGAENGHAPDTNLDESLYSRQLYVLGHSAMKKMAKSRVLITGLGGLGAEIAKNVILAGAKEVFLHDDVVVDHVDLASQFYLSEADVGKNRAAACLEKFRELNSYVKVDQVSACDRDTLAAADVLVCIDRDLDVLLSLNQMTRELKIKFVAANTFGLFAIHFNDFGDDFEVNDATGEEPLSVMISGITSDGVVTCQDESRHGFSDGDHVTFSEVEGLEELNGCDATKIEVTGPYTFKISGEWDYKKYVKGGIATQVKMPEKVSFKSLKDSLGAEDVLFTDFGKMERAKQIQLAFLTLNEFKKEKGRAPQPWSKADSDDFVRLAKSTCNQVLGDLEIDSELLSTFAHICQGRLAPMAAAFGGIAAQEVLKSISGKFMPIKQWMFFDALECLPKQQPLSEEDCKSSQSRYDGQTAVFGKAFQDKLGAQKYFVVGAGAIGCELLKNFAMMGLGTGAQGGHIIVTDMDTIEKSNLNRQFLFRSWDVGKTKASCAAAAIKVMNPELSVIAQENRVGPETEKTYNDDFFESLNGVANALDNVEARTYMDRRCVYYKLPLLESGTLGTKGNTQVVIPDLTESYSSSQDPPEKSIPICTLKNFPNKIEHTLQWARDAFEGTFSQGPEVALKYLAEENFLSETCKQPGTQPCDTLEQVKQLLITQRPDNFEDCVAWSRLLFQDLFHNQIAQLLYNFPPDQKTSTGQLFWSGPKRCPKPVIFDASCRLHMEFVVAAANLRAEVYGLKGTRDEETIRRILKSVHVPEFKPKDGVKIAANDSEAQSLSQSASSDENILQSLRTELEKFGRPAMRVKPIEFEKDDDSNGHMDFIVACSNLRAENYAIPPADRHKSKLIAGRIIPAIATTTSLVAGLVGLELYKVVQGHRDIEHYRNSFANLALPFLTLSEPIRAPKAKYYEKEWSLWDRFELAPEKELTLKEFIDYFKEKEKLEITMISQGVSMLYSFFMAAKSREERMVLPMSQVVEKVSKKPIEPHINALVFEICCNDEDGEDVEVPYVKYVLPKKSK